jgi:hypothetical protein
VKTKLQAATTPRRPNGKADREARRAERRATWEADLLRACRARWGIEPVGPDLPALLDESFAANRSAVHTAALIGKRFNLVQVSTWDPTSW